MSFCIRATLLTVFLALPLVGCVDGSTGGSESDNFDADAFDFTAMFANYADNIILPNLRSRSNTGDRYRGRIWTDLNLLSEHRQR